jgi:hypothetical protein
MHQSHPNPQDLSYGGDSNAMNQGMGQQSRPGTTRSSAPHRSLIPSSGRNAMNHLPPHVSSSGSSNQQREPSHQEAAQSGATQGRPHRHHNHHPHLRPRR